MTTSPEAAATLQVRGLEKVYTLGATVVRALDGVDLTVRPGEFVALVGASGSGKSTLLNIVGGIDEATGGTVALGEQTITGLGDRGLTALRRHQVGIVFQFFNLLPTLSAVENVALPALLVGRRSAGEVERRAKELLTLVGLGSRFGHRPSELSGGEQQRVAIARALINNPPILLADEPTGNLDSRTGADVLDLLTDLHRRLGKTLLMATHSAEAAAVASRIITMRDGKIVETVNAEVPSL